MNKRPKKYDTRDVVYDPSSGDKNGKPNFAYIPQEPELDKMKSEIKNVAFDYQEIDGEHESFMVVDLNDVLQIIDKYKEESEKQEPCEDTVSRQAVLDMINNCLKIIDEYKAESEEQEHQWIPVSERLPEVGMSVLGITVFDDIYVTDLYDICGSKKWFANGCYDVPIVAWMPLPQPYKESEK